MKIKMKRFLGLLLSLALMLGLMPGLSLTAYADGDDPYASIKNTTTVVHFDSKDWYLIDYDSSTVTLLAKECVAASPYNSSGSFVDYSSNPTVKSAVDTYYNSISESGKTAVDGNGMFLLTTAQASTIHSANPDVLKCSQASGAVENGWWLCSQGSNGTDAYRAAFVSGASGIVQDYGASVNRAFGVRPALKLDLSSVIFEFGTNTFFLSYQTITAEDVTATYGDMDKKVNASVTDPATGGGAISYAVKDGSADYIDVNAFTGALTIKKVPADGKAYVIVTAAATGIYGQTTKEVTVTIAKDNSSANIPEIGTIKYSGEPQELVTEGTVENGIMMYALGSDDKTAPAKDKYETSIPTGTNPGTYYVWYYAKGNDGYEDSTPVCVVVTIIELKADTDIDENLLPRDKNTSVDTNGEIPVPDGLKNEAQILADTTGEKVELKLVVAPKGEEKVTESETLQTDAQMSNNIKNQYKDENSVSVEVLEIDIEKYINDTKSDNLKETSKVLEIAIPYNWDGKYDPVVVRRHNDNVQVFTSLSEKATGEPKDGTFFADRDNHILYIYANLFSTYVVAYSSVEGNAQTIVASGGSSSSQPDYPDAVPVYRLYNKYKGAHLFTTNKEERDILLGEKAAEGWTDEGIAFETAVNSGTPVYRVFDLKNGIHYYTSDATVRDTYVANGCRDEGIAWYAAIKTGRTVYKVSNPANGRLLYTISKAEADAFANTGFTCQEAEFIVY